MEINMENSFIPSVILLIITTSASIFTVWKDQIIDNKANTAKAKKDEVETYKDTAITNTNITATFFIIISLVFAVWQLFEIDNEAQTANQEKNALRGKVDSLRGILDSTYIHQLATGIIVNDINNKARGIIGVLNNVDTEITANAVKAKESFENIYIDAQRLLYALGDTVNVSIQLSLPLLSYSQELNDKLRDPHSHNILADKSNHIFRVFQSFPNNKDLLNLIKKIFIQVSFRKKETTRNPSALDLIGRVGDNIKSSDAFWQYKLEHPIFREEKFMFDLKYDSLNRTLRMRIENVPIAIKKNHYELTSPIQLTGTSVNVWLSLTEPSNLDIPEELLKKAFRKSTMKISFLFDGKIRTIEQQNNKAIELTEDDLPFPNYYFNFPSLEFEKIK